MDPHSRHRRRPSSDRFLTTFFPPSATPSVITITTTNTTDEFDEDDFFFTTSPFSPTTTNSPPKPPPIPSQRSFKLEPSGILAVLPEAPASPPLSIFNHKPRHPLADSTTTTPSRTIPILPRPSSTLPAKYVASSAPIHVPTMPVPKGRRQQQRRSKGSAFGFEDIDDEVNGADNDDEQLPPHELVARRMAETPVVSCSVLEGAGRTLKGRDLRRVRNAVFRRTGFID